MNKGEEQYVGIITEDLMRLQRICNLERSLVILTLDFKARSKELKEEIEKLRKGGNKCSEKLKENKNNKEGILLG